jgi:putative FmdB family regulatory protein
MPIYDVNCPNCGEVGDIWAKVTEIYALCPNCGAKTERLISATRIICDIEPYWDENLSHHAKSPHGCYVQSRQDRKRKMKELGLAEIG